MSGQKPEMTLRTIGFVRSPHRRAEGAPIQPVFANGAEGEVVVVEELAAALDDIEGFERIWLVYWLHQAAPARVRVVPFRDTREHGVFATRAPSRPNPIGLSVVRLLARDGCRLRVIDLDLLDGTPLLDIKPYVPLFDAFPKSRAGWLDEGRTDRRRADARFREDGD